MMHLRWVGFFHMHVEGGCKYFLSHQPNFHDAPASIKRQLPCQWPLHAYEKIQPTSNAS